MKVRFTCEWCGRAVDKTRTPAQLRHGGNPKYCSQKCNGAAREGTGTGRTVTHRFMCEACGKPCEVYRAPSAVLPRFCSVACTGAAQRGGANPAFTGGRLENAQGYVWLLMPDHPHADCRGYVYEHRVVMERIVGRTLDRTEVVHHVNRVRNDNRPENLRLMASHAEHLRLHHEEDARDRAVRH